MLRSFLVFVLLSSTPVVMASSAADIERGRYLVRISGCNDCHTPGYPQRHGDVPEAQWLTGDRLGWSGPWGTTYGTNLRLSMLAMDEEGWVRAARTVEWRPPMPWFNLRHMSEEDLRAIYRFVASLGPAAGRPGQEPPPPFARFP